MLPVVPERRQGGIIITAIYTNTSAIFPNISITFPPLCSGVTFLLPAVIST